MLRTEWASKSPAKELSKQLFWRHFFLESSSSSWEPSTATASSKSTSCCRRWVKSRIRIPSKLVVFLLLIRIAQDLKRLAHQLERIVRTLVSILIRVRQKTQFPVRLFDVAVAACGFYGFEAEDFVVGRRRTAFYAYYCRFLLDGECSPAAAVVVAAEIGRASCRERVWLLV